MNASTLWDKLKGACERGLRANPVLQGLPYWIAALIVGFVATGYAEAFLGIEHFVHDFFRKHPYSIWWLSPTCLVAGWALVHYVSPGAGGSGIPQVLAVYELENRTQYSRSVRLILGARVWVTKILSSLLGCLGGGSLANEGPTIQIASGLFFSVGKRFQRVWPQLRSDFFIVAGAGAGVAAAFNTPLGGIVYSIEEFSSAQLNRLKTVLLSAVIISGLIAQSLVGSYLYLGFPRLEPLTAMIYPWIVILALLGGWWGALLGHFVRKASQWRQKRIDRNWKRLVLAILLGLAIAALFTFVDTRILGGGRNVVVDLLFSSSDNQASLSLVLVRFFGPLLTYMSGVAGGLFGPALAGGGSLGAYFGSLVDPTHSNIFILIGMISFMTGVTRLPFTSFVLVLEMTDRHSAIFPMMLAALLAQASARIVDPQNLYEHLKPFFAKKLRKDPEHE
jgi:H+/Cl- antiporter ClcA